MTNKKPKPVVEHLKKFERDNPEFARVIKAMVNTPPISNKEIVARSKRLKKKTK